MSSNLNEYVPYFSTASHHPPSQKLSTLSSSIPSITFSNGVPNSIYEISKQLTPLANSHASNPSVTGVVVSASQPSLATSTATTFSTSIVFQGVGLSTVKQQQQQLPEASSKPLQSTTPTVTSTSIMTNQHEISASLQPSTVPSGSIFPIDSQQTAYDSKDFFDQFQRQNRQYRSPQKTLPSTIPLITRSSSCKRAEEFNGVVDTFSLGIAPAPFSLSSQPVTTNTPSKIRVSRENDRYYVYCQDITVATSELASQLKQNSITSKNIDATISTLALLEAHFSQLRKALTDAKLSSSSTASPGDLSSSDQRCKVKETDNNINSFINNSSINTHTDTNQLMDRMNTLLQVSDQYLIEQNYDTNHKDHPKKHSHSILETPSLLVAQPPSQSSPRVTEIVSSESSPDEYGQSSEIKAIMDSVKRKREAREQLVDSQQQSLKDGSGSIGVGCVLNFDNDSSSNLTAIPSDKHDKAQKPTDSFQVSSIPTYQPMTIQADTGLPFAGVGTQSQSSHSTSPSVSRDPIVQIKVNGLSSEDLSTSMKSQQKATDNSMQIYHDSNSSRSSSSIGNQNQYSSCNNHDRIVTENSDQIKVEVSGLAAYEKFASSPMATENESMHEHQENNLSSLARSIGQSGVFSPVSFAPPSSSSSNSLSHATNTNPSSTETPIVQVDTSRQREEMVVSKLGAPSFEKDQELTLLQLKSRESSGIAIPLIVKDISPFTYTLDRFQIGKKLGAGKFADVYAAIDRQNGFRVALKQIKKSTIQEFKLFQDVINEIRIQGSLHHPNIIQLYGFFIDEECIFLIQELACGKELFAELKATPYKKFTESQTAFFIRQIIEALIYMHQKGVVHRDIKPENIMIYNGLLKLCDFGYAATVSKKKMRTTFCGTLDYVSPEMVQSKPYDFSVDIWSLGILTYELLIGYAPFTGRNQEEIFDEIVNGDLRFSGPISFEAGDFITQILQRDPSERISLSQCLKHPFIQNEYIKRLQSDTGGEIDFCDLVKM